MLGNGGRIGEDPVGDEGVGAAGFDGEGDPSRVDAAWGRRLRLGPAPGGGVRRVDGQLNVTGRDEVRADGDGHGQRIAQRQALAGWPGVEPVEKHAPQERLGPRGVSLVALTCSHTSSPTRVMFAPEPNTARAASGSFRTLNSANGVTLPRPCTAPAMAIRPPLRASASG